MGKGKFFFEGKAAKAPPGPLTSDLGLEPKGWKVKCRTDRKFCHKFLQTVNTEYGWNYILIQKEIEENYALDELYYLSKKESAKIKEICWFKGQRPKPFTPRYTCYITREMYIRFWEHNGPYTANPKLPKKGERRAANVATGESSNVGVWVAVAILLCLILAAIGSYFCLCREGKKKKEGKDSGGGSLSQRGSKAGKSSKRIGKSRISSRKSAKKSGKLGSLRSKSAKGSGPSKGAKSRPSKSSAKSLKKK